MSASVWIFLSQGCDGWAHLRVGNDGFDRIVVGRVHGKGRPVVARWNADRVGG